MKRITILFLILTTLITSCQKEAPKSELETQITTSKALAINWFKNNFREKGIWTYTYLPESDSSPKQNNALRQLMASKLAAELAHKDQDFAEMHKKNLEFIFQNWYQEKDNIAYIYYNNKSKLGANAMMLRTLTYSPHFNQYKTQATKVADGIISLQQESGEFQPWLIAPNYKYDSERLLNFYSGEAILSLVEFYEKTQDPKYLEAAQKSQDYYLEKYVENIDDNYYPAYVPWHTQSLNRLFKITEDDKYVKAIFILNDKLLEIQDTTKYIGRFYNPKFPQYGTPHAASDGVYTEGLAYALEIAQLTNDVAHQKKYQEAIELGLKNLFSLQYCNRVNNPKYNDQKVCGAFKYNRSNDSIRIDTTQHTIDAMIQIEKIDID